MSSVVCFAVGARPNFVKMAPIIHEAKRKRISYFLVHTGQHYDEKMSRVFFRDLKIPKPDIYLGVGSGSHAEQTAKILVSFERVCCVRKPSLIVVSGDVNSTLACSLAASKLNIPIAHIEAGLRSFDRTMPEEINRIITDHLSTLLFTTEPSGNVNLLNEGIYKKKIHFVGNSMIDSLKKHAPIAMARKPWEKYGFLPHRYGIVTFHRPSNVDYASIGSKLMKAISIIAKEMPIIFPVHPRTLARSVGRWHNLKGVMIVQPLGYIEFMGLMAMAKVVITDSGGIQEETTALHVPCITVRSNTERPITLSMGTNRLVSPEIGEIINAVHNPAKPKKGIPNLWDGHAALRIVRVIEKWLHRKEG